MNKYTRPTEGGEFIIESVVPEIFRIILVKGADSPNRPFKNVSISEYLLFLPSLILSFNLFARS